MTEFDDAKETSSPCGVTRPMARIGIDMPNSESRTKIALYFYKNKSDEQIDQEILYKRFTIEYFKNKGGYFESQDNNLSFDEFIQFCFELSKEFPKINFDEGFKEEFEKISSQSKNIELDSEDEELKAKLDLKNMVHDMRREICRRAIYKPSGMINFEVVKMLFSEESLLYRQPK